LNLEGCNGCDYGGYVENTTDIFCTVAASGMAEVCPCSICLVKIMCQDRMVCELRRKYLSRPWRNVRGKDAK